MLNQFARTELLLGAEAMAKLAHSRVAIFGVGGVGGFTTFSSFGHETFSLINAGRLFAAVGYVGGSVLVGLIAATIGVFVARAL